MRQAFEPKFIFLMIFFLFIFNNHEVFSDSSQYLEFLGPKSPNSSICILATGQKNPVSSGTYIAIYDIILEDGSHIPLDTISLADDSSWILKEHSSMGKSFLEYDGVNPSKIEFVLSQETHFVNLIFRKCRTGGLVLVQGPFMPVVKDLYDPKFTGDWDYVTINCSSEKALFNWDSPKTTAYRKSLLRNSGIVRQIDTSSGKVSGGCSDWKSGEPFRFQPGNWPAVPRITFNVPSRVDLEEVFLPAQAKLIGAVQIAQGTQDINISMGVVFNSFDGKNNFESYQKNINVDKNLEKIEINMESKTPSFGQLMIYFDSKKNGNRVSAIVDLVDPVLSGDSPIPPKRKNVILFTLDTTRADHLSVYGYERKTTPFLETIASESIVFDNAYSQCPTTQPSHYSLFTSRYCNDLGIWNNSASYQLPRKEITLSEVLQAKGWRTGAVVSVKHIGSKSGLQQGVDEFYDCLYDNQLGEITAREAKRFIRSNSDRPFFLWIHFFDAHMPYLPIPEYRNLFIQYDKSFEQDVDPEIAFCERRMGSWIRLNHEFMTGMYDSSLRYQDDQVKDIFNLLTELGLMDQTIIVIAADHGESLGEHNIYYNHAGLYETMVHVPMIIKVPNNSLSGTRIQEVVENVDIAPTVLSLLGIEPPDSFRGSPLLSGDSAMDNTAFFEHHGSGFRKGDLKFIDERKRKIRVDLKDTHLRKWWEQPEFLAFDLKGDTHEMNNLALKDGNFDLSFIKQQIAILGEWIGKDLSLEKDVREPTPTPSQPLKVDPELLKSLKALGYIQ